MNTTNVIESFCSWYASQCNGRWEHGAGIKISTIDNPGWHLEVDLTGTVLQDLRLDKSFKQERDDDWLYYEVKDCKLTAAGDPMKLEEMLNIFLRLTV
jgi:hypothetical protein